MKRSIGILRKGKTVRINHPSDLAFCVFAGQLIYVAVASCAAAGNDTAVRKPVEQYGAAGFLPTPEHPVGWRGDGNGRFPAAEPPLTWVRVSASVQDLNVQAAKPGPDDKGTPVPDGVIREWLTLGPIDIPANKSARDDVATAEAGLAPAAGDVLDGQQWKTVTLDTSWLNFAPMCCTTAAVTKGVVAYAHTWIHSSGGKPVFLDAMWSGTAKVWLNGKEAGVFGANGSRVLLALDKGWNRLLLRVAPATDAGWTKGAVQWHFAGALFGTEHDTYESRNILWSTPMPDNGPGVGSPILVGDRLFVTTDAGTLVCIGARDGKVLWARSSTYADAATPEERANHADGFAEVDALMATNKAVLLAYGEAPEKFRADGKTAVARIGWNENRINDLLRKMHSAKYIGQSRGEAGESAPTPVSDGQHVYVLYGSGVAACFDLTGNRVWTTVVGLRQNEHGYCASPCLIGGKLIVKASSALGAVALDGRTGAVVTPMPLWKSKGLHMFSSLLPVVAGGQDLVVQSFGVITRVGDGRILAQNFTPPYYNIFDYVSPTVENGILCSGVLPRKQGNMRFAFQMLPASIGEPLMMKDTRECEYDLRAFPAWFSFDHCASPLLYQGLAYALSVDGVLTVIDAAKGEVVYQKLLDVSPIMNHSGTIIRAGCSSSPTLGGKHIYIWDDQGSTVVIEPGRAFKQVARNRIEQPWFRYGAERNECTISNPIFSGNRIFYRGEVNLYCIGQTHE